jgi:hypothetical protein
MFHLQHHIDCMTDESDDYDDETNIDTKVTSMVNLRRCAQMIRTYMSNSIVGQWATIIFHSNGHF